MCLVRDVEKDAQINQGVNTNMKMKETENIKMDIKINQNQKKNHI